MIRRVRVALLLIAAMAAACSPAATGSGDAVAAVAAGNEVTLMVTAQAIWFEPTLLRAPAGRNLAIVLENRDLGTPHDIALMAGATFSVKLGSSEIVAGPASAVLRVPGLIRGNYRLMCEVHPLMTVDLEVD